MEKNKNLKSRKKIIYVRAAATNVIVCSMKASLLPARWAPAQDEQNRWEKIRIEKVRWKMLFLVLLKKKQVEKSYCHNRND